ncbi:gfo/Idh/MocA family oxidoreductase [Mycetocola tolaasinivorans]|uniref:Gfo/Idh/MocA family oxidoreductase n=1 Tax=Mycetocola tolaasinivorans TaxID=76635 RepID=A0A3L7A9T1_9MICO|nr:Gfo/Idh/MocA family oxidoreductase [Mycetocola tolaasinivorans]RLP76142.1 gfo/Idh/MocA family oxidoreductase [Mycetocola tolaasinivorans]
MSHAVFSDTASPVRIILVGAGAMGKNWLRALTASPDAQIVGLVDLNLDAARAALAAFGLEHLPVGDSVSALAADTDAQAVVNVTIPAAHHAVSTEALFAGLPVLCEKPIAPTVATALSLAASAEASGQLLMTSQSRRYYRSLSALRERVRELGRVGTVSCEFAKAPRFGGFRDEMDHVLLVDMAIHQFDAVRYLLDRDPVAVYCEEYNPAWSWYAGDAAAAAVFEFEGGIRFVYSGSWCTPGSETSWNGSWRIGGENGTALWDGERAPVADLPGLSLADLPARLTDETIPFPEEINGSLAEFISALRTGDIPATEVHANVHSLAMVEAAVLSATRGSRVVLADVLAEARDAAIAVEKRADVREILIRG